MTLLKLTFRQQTSNFRTSQVCKQIPDPLRLSNIEITRQTCTHDMKVTDSVLP